MPKKKTRKAPAMAPVIRQRVDPMGASEPAADPRRPDPDLPPMVGTTGRPSVYSEWLNTTARPPAPSAWLNSPTGDGSALRAAIQDVGLGLKAAAPQPEGQPGPRKRLSTRARKLAQAERIQLDPGTMRPGAADDPRRQLAPTVPGRPTMGATSGGNAARSTRGMPAGGRTAGGATPRGTAGRLPAIDDQPTARVAASPRFSAGPASAARDTATNAALTRQATAQVAAARKTGGLAAGSTTSTGDSSVLIRGAREPKPTGPVVPRRLRPPSFVMQGVVALATVVVLMGVLTVSSPLGYGAAVSGTFQAYANAVPWIPTPTPTHTPAPLITTYGNVPPSPGQQVIINEIQQIFGQYAQGALNVSHCESGWDPSARNPYPVGNSHAEGVFQILYPSTWNTTSYASRNPYDYDANIRAAWEIFHRDGNSWVEWECRP